MSIFDRIKNALFNRHAEAAETPAATRTTSAPPTAGAAPSATQAVSPAAPSSVPAPTASVPQSSSTPAPAVAAPAPAGPTGGAPVPVDVAAIMDAAVKESGQPLKWRTSIVDTMKALGLDSDIGARKELAQELGYAGDTGDSATMNVWLQKALMKKLSENGGKVPAELMD